MTGYKINSRKSVAFLYSKDKQTEKEIREMTPFIIEIWHPDDMMDTGSKVKARAYYLLLL